jgi:hypothetical protein
MRHGQSGHKNDFSGQADWQQDLGVVRVESRIAHYGMVLSSNEHRDRPEK